MRITKIGHSCLLIEEGKTRLLFDPGKYSTAQNELTNLNAIFITHQHQDHVDPESVKVLLEKNPGIHLYANQGVEEVLKTAGIAVDRCEKGRVVKVGHITVTAIHEHHAPIHPMIPAVPNTSFLLDDILYIPGDTVQPPMTEVKAIALPVCAPWLRLADAIDMTLSAKPKICFPIHDGWFKDFYGPFHELPAKVLGEAGIQFVPLKPGESLEIE
jgi:L-ascorbate metabolism protein UlaG (beta-lactamase superfamily)